MGTGRKGIDVMWGVCVCVFQVPVKLVQTSNPIIWEAKAEKEGP